MVRAIDVRTVGLGGDSEVHLGAHGKLTVGPQRVVPIALLGARHPEMLALLEADLADIDGGSSLHGRFVLLPFGARGGAPSAELSAREREVLDKVTAVPQPLRRLGGSLAAQRAIASLKRKGLVQVAGFTPSDAAHVLGLQSNWSVPAAQMAAQLACRLRDMKLPTPERTAQFAQDVWSETVRLSARTVLDTAFGEHLREDRLLHAVCAGDGTLGLARITVTPTVPVVAVGGPVLVYYREVARRLGCEVVFPEHCEVANAVGAATGVVAQSVTVRVVGDGSGLFQLHAPVGARPFTDPQAALQAAEELARQTAADAVVAMGASDPQVRVTVQKTMLPNAVSDTGLLEAVVVAEAVGRPQAVG
jgi:N-methylhydantoinase A/oxoprolinase/acetone carboxylase beta subunit